MARKLLVVEDGHPRTHVVPDGRPAAVPRRVVVGSSAVGDEAWCAVWHQAVPREACRERRQGPVVEVSELGVRQHLEVGGEEGFVEVVEEGCDDSRGWKAAEEVAEAWVDTVAKEKVALVRRKHPPTATLALE